MLILVIIQGMLYAQEKERQRKIKILPVPAFGYSPETRFYLGAVSLFTIDLYQDSVTRTSNAKLEFNYTWNRQVITEVQWNYFFRQERWFTGGQLHFSDYPDQYFGIGSQTPESNRLIFESNRIVIDISGLKKIGTNLFNGPSIRYHNYSNISSELHFPELKDAAVLGVGNTLVADSRNNILSPEKGSYIHVGVAYNFSDSNYADFIVDLRKYKTWKSKYTLAVRLLNTIKTGNPPFYNLSVLGGDRFVRGYFYGRFRDNNLSTLQSEIRMPVYWRIGIALFGGVSSIYSFDNPNSSFHLKPNAGIGLRFMVDKKDKTNLRFDYAIGAEGNSGFYVAFGESF